MGAAALPIALGSMGGASLLQYAGTRAAGRMQEIESETMARQEELGAVQREADRKQSLVRAMASQNAEAGAKGVAAFEGSPLAILQADIEQERTATMRDVEMSKISAMTTRFRGKMARRQADFLATVGLIGDVGKITGISAASK